MELSDEEVAYGMHDWMKEVDKCAWERWEKKPFLLTHKGHVIDPR